MDFTGIKDLYKLHQITKRINNLAQLRICIRDCAFFVETDANSYGCELLTNKRFVGILIMFQGGGFVDDRVIFHCDCNSFFASVESVSDPNLKNVPMAVAGNPENRHGIILAKNELAKKYNVQTAEPIWQARRKCPNLICVPPHYDKYHDFYVRINEIYLQYTDLVEPFSIDESYLDVTGTLHLFDKSPGELADEIRERVKREIGITISVGVSFCKVFAKLGSDYMKPDATTVIMREDVERIVYPLPVSDLLFVGKKTASLLATRAIHTVADLSVYDESFLIKLLGKQGASLYKNIHGLEDDPVRSFYDKYEVKSVSKGMTFKHDLTDEDEVRCGVNLLSDSVAERLRAEHKKGYVIQVTIKDTSLKSIQRQRKLPVPTHLKKQIYSVAMELIFENWEMGKPIRLISVGCSELVDENEEVFVQQSLFETSDDTVDSSGNSVEKQEKIEDAIADIRKKYGRKSINLGYTNTEEMGIGTIR